MKILITSGGTKVPIDRVRSITNMSSGTFGSKIATEALKKGCKVVFFKAKGSKTPFSINTDVSLFECNEIISNAFCLYGLYAKQYHEYEYVTFDDYMTTLKRAILNEQPDVIVLAAAVSDYGVEDYVDGKIRSSDALTIQLKPLPKIISMVKQWAPRAKLVGFKLLVDSTENELYIAAAKSITDNHCDMVVANDLRDIKDNNHMVMLVKENSTLIVKSDPNDPNYLAREVVKAIEKL